MRCYAYILARSGSKGVPDKNIREVAGHPLFAYSIAFARKLKPELERIIVSTDSAHYRDIALRYGAECPYLRGAAASSDTALDEAILQDMADNLPRLGIAMPDIWVRLKPTCPFRSVRSVAAAIAALEADASLDSVRIISVADARLHHINADGFLAPLSSLWDLQRSIMAREEFPQVFKPLNLGVFRHSGFVERGAGFMGHRIKPIVEHKVTGIDIDDEEDLELARALIAARPRPAFLEPFVHDPD